MSVAASSTAAAPSARRRARARPEVRCGLSAPSGVDAGSGARRSRLGRPAVARQLAPGARSGELERRRQLEDARTGLVEGSLDVGDGRGARVQSADRQGLLVGTAELGL